MLITIPRQRSYALSFLVNNGEVTPFNYSPNGEAAVRSLDADVPEPASAGFVFLDLGLLALRHRILN